MIGYYVASILSLLIGLTLRTGATVTGMVPYGEEAADA